MTDPRDYNLDLSTTRDASANHTPPANAGTARLFISVHFACCGVYRRIYRSADGKRYEGHCPRCAKPVRFVVGAGGTDARQFLVE